MTIVDPRAAVNDCVVTKWMLDPAVIAASQESEIAYRAWNAIAPPVGAAPPLSHQQRAAYRRAQQADDAYVRARIFAMARDSTSYYASLNR